MKWRYFKAKWTGHEDWLSPWDVELDKYWRYNHEHKVASSATSAAGANRDTGEKSVEHVAGEWSDGEDSGLDQLEQYLSEQPDRSYSSADSPIKYWLARTKDMATARRNGAGHIRCACHSRRAGALVRSGRRCDLASATTFE